MADNGWKDGNRVRFHKGRTEVIGGWIESEWVPIGADDQVVKIDRVIPDLDLRQRPDEEEKS